MKTNCVCGKQIVWYFEKPTIMACPKCEKTFYYDKKYCECGSKIYSFVCEEDLDE